MSTLIKQSDGTFKKTAGLYKSKNIGSGSNSTGTSSLVIRDVTELLNDMFNSSVQKITVTKAVMLHSGHTVHFVMQYNNVLLGSSGSITFNQEDMRNSLLPLPSKHYKDSGITIDGLSYISSGTASKFTIANGYLAYTLSKNTAGSGRICFTYMTDNTPEELSSETVIVTTSVNNAFDNQTDPNTGDVLGGTVTGAGTYSLGDSVTLSAVAQPDYEFAGYVHTYVSKNGNINNKLLSTDPEYTFTVTYDTDIKALFAVKNKTYKINITNSFNSSSLKVDSSKVTVMVKKIQTQSDFSWADKVPYSITLTEKEVMTNLAAYVFSYDAVDSTNMSVVSSNPNWSYTHGSSKDNSGSQLLYLAPSVILKNGMYGKDTAVDLTLF